MTTLYTAKKYAVPALEAHCVEFLKKNLRADNAFMLLTQVSLPAFLLSARFAVCYCSRLLKKVLGLLQFNHNAAKLMLVQQPGFINTDTNTWKLVVL